LCIYIGVGTWLVDREASDLEGADVAVDSPSCTSFTSSTPAEVGLGVSEALVMDALGWMLAVLDAVASAWVRTDDCSAVEAVASEEETGKGTLAMVGDSILVEE
jgi:hypothetical protein